MEISIVLHSSSLPMPAPVSSGYASAMLCLPRPQDLLTASLCLYRIIHAAPSHASLALQQCSTSSCSRQAAAAADGTAPTLPPTPPVRDGGADSDIPGTVMVRDVVQRHLVAHFRAHESPLSLLEFDPSGTLLITASIRGHSIYLFQICPAEGRSAKAGLRIGAAVRLYRCDLPHRAGQVCAGPHMLTGAAAITVKGCSQFRLAERTAWRWRTLHGWNTCRCTGMHHAAASCAARFPGMPQVDASRAVEAAPCLGRLSRGVTPAVIQSVAFSACSNLLAVSSARGTTHLFPLAAPRANSPASQLQDTASEAAGGGCNRPTMRPRPAQAWAAGLGLDHVHQLPAHVMAGLGIPRCQRTSPGPSLLHLELWPAGRLSRDCPRSADTGTRTGTILMRPCACIAAYMVLMDRQPPDNSSVIPP